MSGRTRHQAPRRTIPAALAGLALVVAPAHGVSERPDTTTDHGLQAKGAGAAALRQGVIAGGGGTSAGGGFAVTGTIGQADPDPLHPTTGGMFAVGGGFWPGTLRAAPPGDAVFGNGFESGGP